MLPQRGYYPAENLTNNSTKISFQAVLPVKNILKVVCILTPQYLWQNYCRLELSNASVLVSKCFGSWVN